MGRLVHHVYSKNSHARSAAPSILTPLLAMQLFYLCSRHLCKVLEAEGSNVFTCWQSHRLLRYGRDDFWAGLSAQWQVIGPWDAKSQVLCLCTSVSGVLAALPQSQ